VTVSNCTSSDCVQTVVTGCLSSTTLPPVTASPTLAVSLNGACLQIQSIHTSVWSCSDKAGAKAETCLELCQLSELPVWTAQGFLTGGLDDVNAAISQMARAISGTAGGLCSNFTSCNDLCSPDSTVLPNSNVVYAAASMRTFTIVGGIVGGCAAVVLCGFNRERLRRDLF